MQRVVVCFYPYFAELGMHLNICKQYALVLGILLYRNLYTVIVECYLCIFCNIVIVFANIDQ